MNVELDMPFAIDPQGRIAFTSDPSRILANHVKMIIGTQIGTRVMRPGYGTPLLSLLFDSDDDMIRSMIVSDIQEALQTYEPGVIVQDVSADDANDLDGVIEVSVTYSAANSPLQTVTVPVNAAILYRGGTVQEERSG